MKKLNDGTATIVVRQKIETSEATPKALEVKTNGNQDNVTTCEQKEKLEAKRWKKKFQEEKNVAVIMNNFFVVVFFCTIVDSIYTNTFWKQFDSMEIFISQKLIRYKYNNFKKGTFFLVNVILTNTVSTKYILTTC